MVQNNLSLFYYMVICILYIYQWSLSYIKSYPHRLGCMEVDWKHEERQGMTRDSAPSWNQTTIRLSGKPRLQTQFYSTQIQFEIIMQQSISAHTPASSLHGCRSRSSPAEWSSWLRAPPSEWSYRRWSTGWSEAKKEKKRKKSKS